MPVLECHARQYRCRYSHPLTARLSRFTNLRSHHKESDTPKNSDRNALEIGNKRWRLIHRVVVGRLARCRACRRCGRHQRGGGIGWVSKRHCRCPPDRGEPRRLRRHVETGCAGHHRVTCALTSLIATRPFLEGNHRTMRDPPDKFVLAFQGSRFVLSA